MRLKQIYLVLFFYGILNSAVIAQLKEKSKSYEPLKAGDKVPDYELTNLVNYGTKTARLSDFKGKLLILYFWNTGCKSCIESWPKLLALQNQFKNQTQIILVNTEQSEKSINDVIEKRKKFFNVEMSLPIVCGDKKIKEFLPYSGVPWIAWINSEGVLISQTRSGSLNHHNIQRILKGEQTDMPQAMRFSNRKLVVTGKPLFINENGTANQIFWHSVFGKADREVISVKRISSEEDISEGKFYAIALNISILDMYRLAYSNESPGSFYGLPLNQVSIETDSKQTFLSEDEFGEPIEEHNYSYQLTTTIPTTRGRLKEMMKADLQRYINLNARFEKRRMKCLVFTATDTSQISYKSGPRTYHFSEDGIHLNQISMYELIDNMIAGGGYYYSPYPIVDETRFRGELGNINFAGNVLDFNILDRGLRNYGMRFKLEVREVDMLIISEPKGYVFPYDPE